MSILKRIAEVIVTSAGHPIPTDNAATSLLKGGGFSKLLTQRAQANTLQVPTPPTPPSDPADLAAQKKYNDSLLAYNQQFQTYHTEVMKQFHQRFLLLQQSMVNAQRSAGSSGATRTASSLGAGGAGVGGILNGDIDI